MAERLVAETIKSFCLSHLGDLEDEASVAAMTPQDAEKVLKLMLACQMSDEKTARFVCGCIDPTRVFALQLQPPLSIDPKVYGYIFQNAQIQMENNECLKHFSRCLGRTEKNDPNTLLRMFHAQYVKNFRDEVLDIAKGNVSIGNELYTSLRDLSPPLAERIADLWQYHVSFPFFEQGQVVIGVRPQEKEPDEGMKKPAKPLPLVPLAHQVEVTDRKELLTRLQPELVRYCVENKLPKHYWNEQFTIQQCVQVALGSTDVPLHRDQTRQPVCKMSQETLGQLFELYLDNDPSVSTLVSTHPQTRLYHSYTKNPSEPVKNPCAFLARLMAHHVCAPQSLPDKYRNVCPVIETQVRDVFEK